MHRDPPLDTTKDTMLFRHVVLGTPYAPDPALMRYAFPDTVNDAIARLGVPASPEHLSEDVAGFVMRRLARRDRSMPTLLLGGDLHGSPSSLVIAKTLVRCARRVFPRGGVLLTERTTAEFMGQRQFVADTVGNRQRALNAAMASRDGWRLQEVMSALVEIDASQAAFEAIPTDTARNGLDPYVIRTGVDMETREDAMLANCQGHAVRFGRDVIMIVGPAHLQAIIEFFREKRWNVVATTALNEPDYVPGKDCQRIGFLLDARNDVRCFRSGAPVATDPPPDLRRLERHVDAFLDEHAWSR